MPERIALTWADRFDWHGWTFEPGLLVAPRCGYVPMNLLRRVGRTAPKSRLAPGGPSMRASCSGTNHERAGLKRTQVNFTGTGHLPGVQVVELLGSVNLIWPHDDGANSWKSSRQRCARAVARCIDGRVNQASVSCCFTVRFARFFNHTYRVFFNAGWERPSAARVKTDKPDAEWIARLVRIGELATVVVPSEGQEAAWDLVRAREDVRGDLMRCSASRTSGLRFPAARQGSPPARPEPPADQEGTCRDAAP